MSIWERFLGRKAEEVEQPNIKFGRYSDSYKAKVCYDAWDSALAHFEAEQHMEAYRAFFRYLRDDEEDNVR